MSTFRPLRTGGPDTSPFRTFFQGGFEGSTLRRDDGWQLDVIAGSQHDRHAAEDYRLLRAAGIGTARDALRWHRIEATPGRYDWSSWQPMLGAAAEAGVQVVWDLCHYGLPHWLDIWSPAFPDRFAAFADAAARLHRQEVGDMPLWCPVNEVSFWAWCGGDVDGIYPTASGRGLELKRQLVSATIGATRAARAVDPRARFVQAEPLIHIAASREEDEPVAAAWCEIQFEACDMIAGRLAPELGGAEDLLDIVGLNFYWDNQWVHDGWTMGVGHHQYRPLHDLLADVHARYARPLLIAETGAEAANGPGWLRYVAGEARTALRMGLPLLGLCLYPVMDYPGWDDDRHCTCGLIRTDERFEARSLDAAMLAQLQEEEMLIRQHVGPAQGTVALGTTALDPGSLLRSAAD